MDSYLDFTVLPDPEIGEAHLLNGLFGKLHLRLANDQNAAQLGVSFPKALGSKLGLGSVLRVHGTNGGLKPLLEPTWLGGLVGHLVEPRVVTVPSTAKYCAVRRVQAKSNIERLRRRQMKRHGIDLTEATKRLPDGLEERIDLPWLQLRSASTGQGFRLFLRQELSAQAEGRFNAYGLSSSATVPWF
jgi:CRISPR-associated endonuclease Csy4